MYVVSNVYMYVVIKQPHTGLRSLVFATYRLICSSLLEWPHKYNIYLMKSQKDHYIFYRPQ